jgi:hypothetical protein
MSNPILKQFYQKNIERNLNPVISAGNFDEDTVQTEIDEYVFTEEIIDGIVLIINAIRTRKYDHDGIWINGYFGSGKSHFLKFLNYCFDPKYRNKAIEKLIEGAKEFDPLTNQKSKLQTDIAQIRDLAEWLKIATIDRIIFNIEEVANHNTEERIMFLDTFWNQFNHFRGYNRYNIALAQYLEKPLNDRGKLDDFKAKIFEEGFDWNNVSIANQLAGTELDLVLEKAKEVMPTLSTDLIRERILRNEIVLSVETFTSELANYLNDKDENYRLIFLVDEVSAFINGHQGLLLQLQEIVTKLHTTCKDKVWVACTAQEDLNEVVEACKVNNIQDAIGKIMGRFQVRMSLKGTKQEYITQKRILEKNGDGEKYLGEMYDQKKNALEAQFHLPATYESYKNKEEFVNYYPFVPYQFRLIQQVFNSFADHDFVNKEVKGNARSIISATYIAAQNTKDKEVGHFVGFDQFFHAKIQTDLSHKGEVALENAAKFAKEYTEDPEFAMRVVYVLFMIANLNEGDKLLFKATVDNLAILLMQDIDAQKLSLKEAVAKVLKYLCDKNAIRMETDKQGEEIYLFYNEEEMEVANLIKNMKVDDSYMAEKLKSEIIAFFSMCNKENYISRSFTVCAEIFNRTFLSTNNPEMRIEFVFEGDATANAETYALTNNENNRLAFYLVDFYEGNSGFKESFFKYCRTCRFLDMNQPSSESRARIYATFRQRATAEMDKLRLLLHDALNKCPIVSGHSVVPSSYISQNGKDRYKNAVRYHLSILYPDAKLVEKYPQNASDLAQRIKAPIPEDSMGLGYQLSEADKKVETHLLHKGVAASVNVVVHTFEKPPYGWAETCTLNALNELVRSRRFEFSYNNVPRPDVKIVADNLLKNQDKFTISVAEAIPQQLVNDFIEAWKDCFSEISVGRNNDAISVFDFCKNPEKNPGALRNVITEYNALAQTFGDRPFTGPLKSAINTMESWDCISEPKSFFETVVAARQDMAKILGQCRDLKEFKDNHFDKFKEVCDFITVNSENFTYLDEEAKSRSEKLKTILTDEWPIPNMRSYVKWTRELTQSIAEVRDTLKSDLRKANGNCYDTLLNTCSNLGLKNAPESYLPAREVFVEQGCEKESLAGLKSALHEVDEIRTSWVGKLAQIHEEENAPSADLILPEQSEPNPAPTGATAKTRKHYMVDVKKALTVQSGRQLKSESDVDAYLNDLKKQLMEHVNDDEFVIVQ